MDKDLAIGVKALQARNDYLLQERDKLARRVVELESERDNWERMSDQYKREAYQLAAQNGRLREQFSALSNGCRRELAYPVCCLMPGQECCGSPDPDWPKWFQECELSALNETPSTSLAEIEAAAIESAMKESTFLGPDGGEYISVDDLRDYAAYIRRSAKKSGATP